MKYDCHVADEGPPHAIRAACGLELHSATWPLTAAPAQLNVTAEVNIV
jgi:hypothetical protein